METIDFGVGTGKLTPGARRLRERIAREHGAEFVYAALLPEGPRHWYEAPNYGAAIDRDRARAVLDAVDRAEHRAVIR